MKALVIGKGKSGVAAAGVLAAEGCGVDSVEGYDLVVASPGVRVVSELQYGCELLRRRGVKLLAVTGSKGKSSVVKAVADALNRAGHPAVACGNYGLPVCGVVGGGEGVGEGEGVGVGEGEGLEWAVVEVSSFQLETTHLAPGTFAAAAVLNLQEDHLDRHGGVEVYHALKLSLLPMAKVALAPDCIARLAAMPEVRGLFAGSYFDNAVLAANGAAAVALLRVAGLSDAEIAAGFAAFEPLPHRFQPVAEEGGVRYVDDSKATSIAAMCAGIGMAGGGVRLIAGGLAKGDDPKNALAVLTERVKKVYLIGTSAEKFSAAWKSSVDCEISGTMEAAVEAARREATKGETVLLSPGCASFDQFNSFGERGEVFARLVKREGQKNK